MNKNKINIFRKGEGVIGLDTLLQAGGGVSNLIKWIVGIIIFMIVMIFVSNELLFYMGCQAEIVLIGLMKYKSFLFDNFPMTMSLFSLTIYGWISYALIVFFIKTIKGEGATKIKIENNQK